MPKAKPPLDAAALEALLQRAGSSIGQLIADGEVDDTHLRRIFHMLERVVLEGEETVEDLTALREADRSIAAGETAPFTFEPESVSQRAV